VTANLNSNNIIVLLNTGEVTTPNGIWTGAGDGASWNDPANCRGRAERSH
jgi:hypothetical protein